MFNLYETILGLCESRGISVYRMSKESGVSRSVMTELKSGRTQSLSTESLLLRQNEKPCISRDTGLFPLCINGPGPFSLFIFEIVLFISETKITKNYE